MQRLFYLMFLLISLSIMLVIPNLNFDSNTISIEDGYGDGNSLYNNYENDGYYYKYLPKEMKNTWY
jgi:hypothetical protein